MRHFILILLCFAFIQNVKAQDTTLAKFLMIGHAYGSQDTTGKQWVSIENNAEKIKNAKTNFYVFLGDALRDTTEKTLWSFAKVLKTKIDSNIFCCKTILVPGNHDYRCPYRKLNHCLCDIFFLKHIQGFSTLNDRMLPYDVFIINSENTIVNLDSLIKIQVKNSTAKNIVFLSHRLIWVYSNPRYKHLVELTNSPTMHQLPQVVDMDFLNQQKDKKFYFFAGDLGVNIPLFYDKVGNVTMYAVGCGGNPKDAALLAEFKRDTILTSLVHLGTANYSIEDYSLEKINTMQLRNETISAQQGFKGYQWPIVLGIFAVMALALYLVITPNE